MTYKLIKLNDDVELKPLKLQDSATLYKLTIANLEYLRMYLPWAKNVKKIDSSRDFIKAAIAKREQGEEFGFGIFVSGKLSGHITLRNINNNQTPEIGYWITQELSGKGITTAAAKAITKLGFDLGLKQILIKADPANIASNRIAEKLGYEYIGQYKDKNGIHCHWLKESS